jgi:hypothetical protein
MSNLHHNYRTIEPSQQNNDELAADWEIAPVSDHYEATKDDVNYPHACLCCREGCRLHASCPYFHFGRQEWTR